MHKIFNNLIFIDHDLKFNTSQTRGHPFKLTTLSTRINAYRDSFIPQPLSCGINCQQRLLLVIIWNHLKRIVTVIFITDSLYLYQNMYIFSLIEVVH